MTLSIPTLETPRLRLRPHNPMSDLAPGLGMWSDPLVYRFIGGVPSIRQQVWVRQLAYLGHWATMGFGYWAIAEKATGEFVGELGFADFKRAVEPSVEGCAELGWILKASAHGKGFATEGVRAALAWGTNQLPEKKIVCLIHPENFASQHVATKCGFRNPIATVYADAPTLLYHYL